MKEKNLFSSTFLRVFPIISSYMVVGIHSYNAGTIEDVTITTLVEGFFSHGLFCGAVPVFFLMSGYLFFCNVNCIEDILKKWKTRAKTVLIPFFAWSSLYYFAYTFAYWISGILKGNVTFPGLGEIIEGIFLYQYCYPLWFMFQLTIYILLAPVLFYTIRVMKSKSWLLVVACFFITILGFDNIGTIGHELRRPFFQINYFGYWVIGAILPNVKNQKKLMEKAGNVPYSALCTLLGIFSLISSLAFDKVIHVEYPRIFVPVIALLYLMLLLKISEINSDILRKIRAYLKTQNI